MTKFADAYPKQLSGGMKQRVAIARALANEPSVLLMDEPFGALDTQTKEQMQKFMQDLWERTHITILMVTHDVEEAIFLSQRIYVMGSHPGTIKAESPIDLPDHRELDLKLEPHFITFKRQVVQALGHLRAKKKSYGYSERDENKRLPALDRAPSPANTSSRRYFGRFDAGFPCD